jgi:hypothetical protein
MKEKPMAQHREEDRKRRSLGPRHEGDRGDRGDPVPREQGEAEREPESEEPTRRWIGKRHEDEDR